MYAALLPALGALVARWALLPALSGVLSAAARTRVERLLGQIGLVAALVVALATALRAWTHTVAAFGFSDAQSWEAIRIIAFESRWGSGWVLQVAAAVLLVLSYLVVQVSPRAGWVLAAASGASMCVALPLLGHAAGSVGRMAIHTAHLLGAGLWIGTLAALWMVARIESRVRPAPLRRRSPLRSSASSRRSRSPAPRSCSWLACSRRRSTSKRPRLSSPRHMAAR